MRNPLNVYFHISDSSSRSLLAMTQKNMNKTIIGLVIALVIVGAGSFYGGMLYGKSKGGAQSLSAQERQQRFGQMGGGQGRVGNRVAGSGFVNGDIIAKDDKSLTIKLRDGGLPTGQAGSKIIFLSGSTQIMKSVDGSISDLSVGQNVMINGSTNADGSLTAQSIQLRTATSTPLK